MSTTTTTTATHTQASHILRPIYLNDESEVTSTTISSETEMTEAERSEDFLTHDSSPTGQEATVNPSSWPTLHRRVPPFIAPRVHQDWVAIGGPLPARIFLWTMFHGCELLQHAYSIPRALGLHKKGWFMYQVAGEW